ncbi:multidrug transporter [Lentzea sp. NBRC 105346]|uniref:DMT family transporter n=1 Tax=Lentzea sp. NBRC 105346 TaxID=3032205 RepID=UPI002555D1BD|nr:EamA family transporter [Lentzea sp. NBRC 105346]GLZ30423.1 multidrug transporter [Lentzea sp. NBRC 105346]
MGVLALLWGSSFLWIKIALSGFSPVQISLIRTVLGAGVLLALLGSLRQSLPTSWTTWKHMLVVAFFGCAVPFTLFAVGGKTVDSGVSGVLNATTPLFALLIGLAIGLEKWSNVVRLTGLVLGFAGVLLIFAPWQKAGLASWGAVACLVAAASYAIAYTYVGRYMSKSGLTTQQLSAMQLVAGAGLLTVALPAGGFDPIRPHWQAFVAVAILGVFGTGIAFILNYRVIADEGATTATSVGYLLPVVSVLLGAAFLHEQLNLRVVAGMLVVLLGVALTRRRPVVAAAPDVSPNEIRDLVKR